MLQKILQSFLILLAISYYIASADGVAGINSEKRADQVSHVNQLIRQRRAIKKPGFFKTLFSVIGEQYTDTKNTIGKVNELVNDNFLPENQVTTEAATPKDPNTTTTAAPYKITRSELNRIIRRNVKGLIRLFNIELKDALKDSKITQAEYKKDLRKEVSKFL